MPNFLMYFLVITVLPENGPDLPGIVTNISKVLNDSTADANILYKFQVVGEATVIAVASAQNNAAINRIVDRLWAVGKFKISSQPIIPYESFAKNIGVSDDLTRPVGNILEPENIYWATLNVDYYNQTTNELLDIWKAEAETVLGARNNGDLRIVLFKNVAEREVTVFFNAPEPAQWDIDSFRLPLVDRIGSGVRISLKGVQFINDC
ncbi:hypothetical protein BsWGS_10333 [Bradybaena similaris]